MLKMVSELVGALVFPFTSVMTAAEDAEHDPRMNSTWVLGSWFSTSAPVLSAFCSPHQNPAARLLLNRLFIITAQPQERTD